MNSLEPLDNVRIVLSHTSHPGNIGGAARAMKTMGLSDLYLVNPKFFPDRDAERRAAGAGDILEKAQVCENLGQALSGTVFAAAVTARRRDLSHEAFNARQGALNLISYATKNRVAVVFGTELSGLTNEEVSRCQIVVHIPADPVFSSLNLASAVQVLAYELRMALVEANPSRQTVSAGTPVTFDDIELLLIHIEKMATRSGFLDPAEPKRLMQRMRRMFARARLEREELNILRGILGACEKQIRNEV
jgi:tRNA/rRNA methyltransferase